MARILGSEDNSDPKYHRIYEYFRDAIVSGLLAPGSQLPTHVEIKEQFGAGPMTVQRALSRLASEGFTRARRGLGTHVAPHPPHLHRYALVFPERSTFNEVHSRFYQVLASQAAKFGDEGPQRIICFWDVDGHTDGEDFQRLEHEVRARRLAGVIFAFKPDRLQNAYVVSNNHTPRVAITSGLSGPDLLPIHLDDLTLLDRGLEHLRKQGRRNVAILTTPGRKPEYHERLQQSIRKFGLRTQPYWLARINHLAPEGAQDVMHLMFQKNQMQRPDALLITDDNLVEHAVMGVMAAGVRVPQDLSIVSHSNFPWPTPPLLPMRRLGYDADEVLSRCVQRLDEATAGKPWNMPFDVIKPVFEDELGQRSTSDVSVSLDRAFSPVVPS